ncbi:ribonuclease H-like domain-containing protein [Paraphoma chrysanthemicola]|nr:ribonuclease H-like domain-containing protein [Paraphoma chrysanthemicola]
MTVWADRKYTFYYPDQRPAIPDNPSTVGVSREWDGEAYEKDLKALVKFGKDHAKNEDEEKRQDKTYRKVPAAIHPLGTELPNLSQALGTDQKLLTNHFQLDIGSSAFYRYEVLDLEQGGRTKKKVQALFRKAVATWDCLRDDQDNFATMVGSMDKEGGAYRGAMRLQSKDKRDREIIEEVESMENLPEHIIYYRDGVSTGQYKEAVRTEVSAILAAHAAVKAKRNNMTAIRSLTAIVGGKRHHTRFYPINDGDKDTSNNNNCLPGTYVDRGILSPYFRDFYLQSHVGIKGTARPTHYFIVKVTGQPSPSLRSDNDLRTLTHRLCYTYCRATCGVSYATPTYYADRLCDRGRIYLPNTWSSNPLAHEARLKSTARTMHEQFQVVRDNTYRNGREYDPSTDNKDDAEITDENTHREEVRKAVRKLTLDFAMKEFYKYKVDVGGDMTGIPWHSDLGKIMFWM